MHKYINDTQFAITSLLRLATAEEKERNEKGKQLIGIEVPLRLHRWDFEPSDLSEELSDASVRAARSLIEKGKQEAEGFRKNLLDQQASIQASISTHQLSQQVISGAILQIAQQGISVVYSDDLKTAPEGRQLCTVPVRDIIWQARNQALHYEKTTYQKSVVDLFSTLEKEGGAGFSLTNHPKQSRATQILELLGWVTYSDYLRDMNSILL